MTEKQERILKTALKLFANEGYAATSTSKVAKEAGVSEGLIFRHFKNKEGLLTAIMEQGAELAKQLYTPIILTQEPKEVIRKTIELPFFLAEDQYEHWRLMYALKWQTSNYDRSKYEALRTVLISSFEKLAYEDPVVEAELLFMLLDGAVTAILLHEPANKMDIMKVVLKKYEL